MTREKILLLQPLPSSSSKQDVLAEVQRVVSGRKPGPGEAWLRTQCLYQLMRVSMQIIID